LFDRLTAQATAFAQQLLKEALLVKVTRGLKCHKLLSYFGKVVLQDSTTLCLPQVLAWLFPGNYSRGQQKAVARIQTIIDVKAMRFLDFVLGAFVNNDQSASRSILSWVKKGDLVIRDLGYFALETFHRLIEKNVHFLSRVKFGVSIYTLQGSPIQWKTLLRENKRVDRWVLMGSDQQVKVRLVMIPLPSAQAAEKRRKARQDRDKRLNHSKEYYQWLGYSIYITSVEATLWTTQQVADVYKVRWQIEIIFKSWKSGFHLQKMLHQQCTNEHRVQISIYLMLLFMCLFMKKIYIYYCKKAEQSSKAPISLLKLTEFFATHLTEISLMPSARLQEFILRYCCYESRKDRINLRALIQI
jgi:hypothetical protein